MSDTFKHFTPDFIHFLEALTENNNREWFTEHKARYESVVRTPALEFITAMAPRIHGLSPHFTASAKKVGGSMMRPYRDIRFSKDKTPYKTNVGIQFRHEAGKDAHAPGFYVHISPQEVFLGVGLWRPDRQALSKIRDHIVDNPNAWKTVTRHATFMQYFQLAGESLVRCPKGYDIDHPLIQDLKRKDFVAVLPMPIDALYAPEFIDHVEEAFRIAFPLMAFLCAALELPG